MVDNYLSCCLIEVFSADLPGNIFTIGHDNPVFSVAGWDHEKETQVKQIVKLEKCCQLAGIAEFALKRKLS